MKSTKKSYLRLIIVSASVISNAIISKCSSALMFVSKYASRVITLANFGIGNGSVYSYFRINIQENIFRNISKYIFFIIVLPISYIH